MRVGVNPLRTSEVAIWPNLLGVVITHLPNRNGYHSRRFPVIKACIESMRQNAGGNLPLLVWDNGSDNDFRAWLTNSCKPDFLIMSPNIGKPAARTALMSMLPYDTTIAFTDDDMLYYPGWLNEQLDLMRAFPNVGAVSGWPVRFSFGWGNSETIKWAKQHAVYEEGRFIPDSDEVDYAESVGMDGKSWVTQTSGSIDKRITYNGVKAYAEAQHCQFIGKTGVLVQFSRLVHEPRHAEIAFDSAIDAAGYLRLTTDKRVCRHMGNVIDPKLQNELRGMGLCEN